MSEFQSTAGEYPTPGQEPSESAGFMSRLTSIFSSPGSFNPRPAPKWEWIIAVLLTVVIGFGALQIEKPYLVPDLKKAALSNIEKFKDQIPAERYEGIKTQIEKGMDENFELSPKTIGIGILAGLIFSAVIALYCWVTGNFFLGGKAPFWQVLTIVAFAGLIGLVGAYAKAGLMVMKETSYVYLGLGLIKPNPDGSFVYYLLRQMEFATMWRIVATCIALGALYQKKSAPFMYLVFAGWLVFISLVAVANLYTGGSIVY